jgi:Undecaprenyl-phosphate glucose phosphotransferase
MAESARAVLSRLDRGEADPQKATQRNGRFLLSAEIISGVAKLADFGLVLMAAAFAYGVYFLGVRHETAGEAQYAFTALFAAILFVVGFQYLGGYELARLRAHRWQVTRSSVMWAGALSVLLVVAFIFKQSDTYSRGWAIGWGISTLAFILFERSALAAALDRWTRQGKLTRNVVVVGAGETGERLLRKLRQSNDGSIAVVGLFDDRKTRIPPSVGGYEVRGTTDDLLAFARRVPVDEIVVALPLSGAQRLKAIFDKLRLLPTDLRLSAEPMTEAFPVRGISYVGDVPMLEIVEKPLKHWNAVAKWVEDAILGSLALVAFGPFMAMVAALIKLDSRGPVFFAQERFGFNNEVIRVLKFRTMYVDRGDPTGAQRTVRNDPRITRVGRFLRSSSLDELPQLLNVLRGEMSLVGPRPHAVAMKAGDRLYHDAVKDYLYRHRVKPGITGLAQVNGLRGEIDTIDKARRRVEYDLDYIERWTVWLDLKILFLSFRILACRENAF